MQVRNYSTIWGIITKKGYKWDLRKQALNFVWERFRDAYTDKFDDTLHICYIDNSGNKSYIPIQATTKPGLFSAHTPKEVDNVLGVAVIVPGQYINCWEWYDGDKLAAFVKQWNKPYPFNAPHFRQVGKLNYWRDFNKDALIDHVQLQQGKLFFTHWHNMSYIGQPGTIVGNWSEGCMGYPEPELHKFDTFVRAHVALYGALFTGTIIETNDFI